MDKLDMKSQNIVNMNVEKIAEMFPNCVVESEQGKAIDFDMLKQELSEDIVEGPKEKYQLTWPGKKEAIVTANTPTTNTLRPVREKSVDFDNTQNIYIEGDNLEALKILQESYLGKIKCIYIDPPYNTGNDFVYNDKFYKKSQEELKDSGVIDNEGNVLISKIINNESDGRFHSNWLSMMYPRLKIARNLLADDGVIFISIDDNEVDNLRKICDEIFGNINFIANLIITSAPAGTQSSIDFAVQQSYCLVYRKTEKFSTSYIRSTIEDLKQKYNRKDSKGNYYIERLWKRGMGGKKEDVPSLHFPVYYNIKTKEILIDEEFNEMNNDDVIKIIPYQTAGVLGRWTWSKEKMKNERENLQVEIVAGEYKLHKKVYECNDIGKKPVTIIDSKIGRTELGSLEIKELFDAKVFDYPKFSGLIEYFINLQGDKNSIILDYFSGSATTAHATLALNSKDNGNRKFIMLQLPEICEEKTEAYENGFRSICDIGEERIRRAAKKIKEETNADIDYGFRVYKIDSSNMKDVYYKSGEINQNQLDIFTSNIKEDRTPEDILTQIILDWGLTLDLPISEKEIKGNKVFYVAENSLVACLDTQINIDIIDEIAKCEPVRVVFRDEAFTKDSDKINVYERLKKLSPKTEVKVI